METQTLIEYTSQPGALRVDRAASIIRGVKVLGVESRNNRRYTDAAITGATKLYESAPVNVNHPPGDPSKTRDYADRLGSLRNITARPGDGIFGDLHYNPRHALSEQLLWDAEHQPEAVGLSHNIDAKIDRRGGQTIVEEITRVRSVDLVCDPATTSGLFESAGEQVDETGADAPPQSGAEWAAKIHQPRGLVPLNPPKKQASVRSTEQGRADEVDIPPTDGKSWVKAIR